MFVNINFLKKYGIHSVNPQIFSKFVKQVLHFGTKPVTTANLDISLRNLKITMLNSLKVQLGKADQDINLKHIESIRALISAIEVYLKFDIPQIDSATGVLMSLSKFQTDRECFVLDAIVTYDKYLTSLNQSK